MRYAAVVALGLLLQGASLWTASASVPVALPLADFSDGTYGWTTGTVVIINEGEPRVVELTGTNTELRFMVERRLVIRGLPMVVGGGLAGCVDRGLGFQVEAQLLTGKRVVWRVAK